MGYLKKILRTLAIGSVLAANAVFAAPTITEAIMGRPVPPRLSLEYQRYMAELQYQATNVVAPLTRATTYYFSTTGNDANDGLSTGAPKQNISTLNTLIGSSGGNTRFRLKCGDVWDITSGIDGDATDDNITLDDYGAGARPLLNGFTSKLPSGGTLWALGAGARYTTAISEPGDFREQLYRDFQYRRVTSTAEVESTPYSWFWSGGTMHVNAGGVDPDTLAYEYTLISTTDDSGIYIPAGATGYRIHGIQCDGWGADGGSTNQEYGIKFAGNGTDKCVVTNCKATRSARHNIGLNGGANSGAWMCVTNCEAGMDTEAGAAPYVFYQQNGGQEIAMFSSASPWGAQPITATRNYADGLAVIAHTNSTSTPPGFIHIQDHLVPVNAQNFGCHNAVAIDNMAYEDNPNECEAVVINAQMEPAVGTGSNGLTTAGYFIARQGTLEIGGDYSFIPLNSATDAMASGDPRGFVYNTNYRVDLTNSGMTEGWFAFYNPTAATNDPKLFGCFFEIKSNGTTDFALSYDCNFGSTSQVVADYAANAQMISSVWSVIRKYPTSTADVIKPGLPNSSAVLRNNAYWAVSADETYIGISSTSNPVYLTHAPIFGVTPAQGSPLALTGRGGYIPYDLSMLPRNVVQPTIGPLEMRTEILIAPTASEMATQIWALDTTNGSSTAGSMGASAIAANTKVGYLPSVTAGAAGGVLIAGSNAATTFSTLTSTGNFTINGVSNVSQTGDSFTRIGATGSGLTSLASQASVNAIDDLLDTEMPALTGSVASVQSDTVTLTGRLSDARAGYLDNLNVGGSVATASSLAIVDGIIDNIFTGMALDGSVYQWTANALELGPVGGGLDAAGVRAAIGMAAADLDDQLANGFALTVSVSDNTETLLARLSESRAGYLDAIPTMSSNINDIETIENKLNSTLEVDGPNWRFTDNALAEAPAGGGGGGTDESVLLTTTIASVSSNTTFTLAEGSNLTSAYIRQTAVIFDASNSEYPTVRTVDQYVGSTRTVVLASAAGFMPTVGDTVKIFVAPDELINGSGGNTIIQNTEETRP